MKEPVTTKKTGEFIVQQLTDLYNDLVENRVTRKDAVTRFDCAFELYLSTPFNEFSALLQVKIAKIYQKCYSLMSEKWGNLGEIISEINCTDISSSDIRVARVSSEAYHIFNSVTGRVLFSETLDLDKYKGTELYEHVLITVLDYI